MDKVMASTMKCGAIGAGLVAVVACATIGFMLTQKKKDDSKDETFRSSMRVLAMVMGGVAVLCALMIYMDYRKNHPSVKAGLTAGAGQSSPVDMMSDDQ